MCGEPDRPDSRCHCVHGLQTTCPLPWKLAVPSSQGQYSSFYPQINTYVISHKSMSSTVKGRCAIDSFNALSHISSLVSVLRQPRWQFCNWVTCHHRWLSLLSCQKEVVPSCIVTAQQTLCLFVTAQSCGFGLHWPLKGLFALCSDVCWLCTFYCCFVQRHSLVSSRNTLHRMV